MTANEVEVLGPFLNTAKSAIESAINSSTAGVTEVYRERGNLYIIMGGRPHAVMAGKTSASTTSGKVSVGSSSTQILAANTSRIAAIVVNDSDEDVYVNLSGTAVMNEGVLLTANGGSLREEAYTGEITGICTSGSKNVTVTEL